MVIGIIGAGLSGLIAGRELSRAGHDVTVLEKSRGFGGRLATRYESDNPSVKFDHGIASFEATTPEFKKFVAELMEQDLVMRWGDNRWICNEDQTLMKDPAANPLPQFTAKGGMNRIGRYLSRWVEVKTNTLVGGLTYFGPRRSRKRAWMINLTSSGVFEADAVIVAVPAPQAYGLLQTATDETDMLRMIRVIDEIRYEKSFSLMLRYDGIEPPDWDSISFRNSRLQMVSNENSKGRNESGCTLVVHTSPAFSEVLASLNDKEKAEKEILKALAEETGLFPLHPQWSQLHFWRYSRAVQTLDQPYMQVGSDDAPLALIGDYFSGNRLEDAYHSGYALAQDWIRKFSS